MTIETALHIMKKLQSVLEDTLEKSNSGIIICFDVNKYIIYVRCTQNKNKVKKIFFSQIIHHSIENFKAVKNMCALRFFNPFFWSKNRRNLEDVKNRQFHNIS
jgi:hypothetical protein